MNPPFIPRVFTAPKAHFFLLGPRGTGKTAWCNQQFGNGLRIDLLNAAVLREYSSRVAIWSTSDEGWLFTVVQPCAGLQSADQIQLTTRNAVVRRGADSVAFAGQKCKITEIRPVDFRTNRR
jgi:hypothetical protein